MDDDPRGPLLTTTLRGGVGPELSGEGELPRMPLISKKVLLFEYFQFKLLNFENRNVKCKITIFTLAYKTTLL